MAQVPYNPNPTAEPISGGSGATYQSVPEANASAFGSGIGEATQKLGQSAQEVGSKASELANEFTRMATEAKVNDDYANKYAPAASELRSQYDQLRGQDKIHGYDGYISGLKNLNVQFTANTASPYERQLMGGLIDRHISGEIDGAKRELVQSQKQFSDQATYDVIKANNGLAAARYNDPTAVQDIAKQNDSLVTIQYMNNGHDPTHPYSAALIEEAQNNAKGEMAVGMINRAVSSGDAPAANAIRANMSPFIPGYQKIALDNFLHVENIRQTSTNTVGALKNGQPVPEAMGAPASQVQALVANTAQTGGIDPNNALAVLRIESANGQNLGTRGTLGQDRESAGKPIEDQAKALCDNLKIANAKATEVLGRTAEGWEGYAVYQQGVGGGPALLKANPNTKAVDVLEGVYGNTKDALSAVKNNGGNASMSVSDFLGHIKQVYNDNADRAKCDFSTPQNGDSSNGTAFSIGDQILSPHQEVGPVVQPATTATQAWLNFNQKAPDILARINSIPNIDVRDGVLRAFDRDQSIYQAAARAEKITLNRQAQDMAVDPTFVDMSQVPPNMRAALSDDPMAISYMERRADYNLKNVKNIASKDKAELGSGFYRELTKVLSPAGDANAVNDASQLYPSAAKGGDLTPPGFDRLKKLLDLKNTPDGQATLVSMRDMFGKARSQITGTNEATGIKDIHGDKLFENWMALTLSSYEKGISSGKTSEQLLSPDSGDYLGNSVSGFKRTITQQVNDMLKDSDNVSGGGSGSGARSLESILGDVRSGKLTHDAGKAEALKLGLIRSDTGLSNVGPSVPVAGVND